LGQRDLLTNVSFHIHPGERVGLIGANGAGKTTLFHVLLGDAEPDSGSVAGSKSLRMGYLPQQWVMSEEKTVLAHAMEVSGELSLIRTELDRLLERMEKENDAELSGELALRQTHLNEQLEHLGGYDLEARAKKVLAGLGFSGDSLAKPTSALSGGWMMRLELARLLLAEPDLLLLDEPTNHLDLESLLWLEQYLLASPSAMILISHDRVFLNRIVKRIMELENGKLREYTGNYDDYEAQKARRREVELAASKNQRDRLNQIERFIEKNRYRKSGARQAQSRLKYLDKVERIEVSGEEDSIRFSFPEPSRSGKRVLELRAIHKSYGDRVIYGGIDMVIERGDRLAFLGPNGAGKSTLLKILAGAETPDKGERILGTGANLAYYAQNQWEQLRPEWTVLQEAFSIAGDLSQARLRGLLGAFLFRGDDVLKRVSALSGGEKARLILCKLLLQRPNVLLLDEPTNHLDIPSRTVLEEALRDFTGSVCFISHDRHFIDQIANRVLVVDAGHIHLFPGNFEDYRSIWRERIDAGPGGEGEPKGDRKPAPSSRPHPGQDRKRIEAELRNELYALKKPLQSRIEALEAEIEKEERQMDALNALLAQSDTYTDGARARDLQRAYQECRAAIRRLTEEWEGKALALEEMEKTFRETRGYL
jgi:ATP-binding cassette subfamily F protein 3